MKKLRSGDPEPVPEAYWLDVGYRMTVVGPSATRSPKPSSD